jgi:hypothetical protein
MAMTIVEGESLQCSYRVRFDHHKAAIAKGDYHLCKFTSMKRPIVQLIRRTHENEAKIWNLVSHRVACYNFSVQAVLSSEFHMVIEHAFNAGFIQALSPGMPPDCPLAFVRDCPRCKATTLRKRIVAIATRSFQCHEDYVKDLPFVAMSMDSGQIGNGKLIVPNVLASNLSYCFTHSIY